MDMDKISFGRNLPSVGERQPTATKPKPTFNFKMNLSSRREKRRLDESPVRENVTVSPDFSRKLGTYCGNDGGMTELEQGARERLSDGPSEVMPHVDSLDSDTHSEPHCIKPIQWASKYKPITTDLISSIAKRVQSGNWNVPVLRNCVKREVVGENTVRRNSQFELIVDPGLMVLFRADVVYQVFVYDVTAMSTPKDFYWRLDKYAYGKQTTARLPKNPSSGELSWDVYICTLESNGKLVAFQRREYKRQGQQYDNLDSWEDPHVYVAYTGITSRSTKAYECFDLNRYIGKHAHGNAIPLEQRAKQRRLAELVTGRPPNKPVVSSATSDDADEDDFRESRSKPEYCRRSVVVREMLREELQKPGSNPMIAHQAVKRKGLAEGLDKTMLPRNRSQAHEVQREINKKHHPRPHDPLWEVLMLSQFQSSIVPTAGFDEGSAYVVVVFPKLLNHVEDMLKNRTSIVFHHDTTFNVGKFLTTLLSFKHPFLEGRPVIPIGIMFHQSKTEDTHTRFMQVMAKRIPHLNSKYAVFVTDRESAIRNSIDISVPNASRACCHKHLMENVKMWVSGKSLDSSVKHLLEIDIRKLLHAETKEVFEQLESRMLDTVNSEWPEIFRNYYLTYLANDVRLSCRYQTEPLGIYYPGTGVSNNPSEAINAVFKHFANVSTPKDWHAAVHKAYFLMGGKYDDLFMAVVDNDGDWKVLPRFSHRFESLQKLERNLDTLGKDGFHSVFYEGTFSQAAADTEFSPESLRFRDGIAEWLIKMNRISIVNGEFFVLSLEGKTHKVDHIKGECTCYVGNCIELLAVEKVLKFQQMCAARSQKRSHPKKKRTLAQANKNSVPKTTGKKAHKKLGPRCNLVPTLEPKEREDRDCIQDPRSAHGIPGSNKRVRCEEQPEQVDHHANSKSADDDDGVNLMDVEDYRSSSFDECQLAAHMNVTHEATADENDSDNRMFVEKVVVFDSMELEEALDEHQLATAANDLENNKSTANSLAKDLSSAANETADLPSDVTNYASTECSSKQTATLIPGMLEPSAKAALHSGCHRTFKLNSKNAEVKSRLKARMHTEKPLTDVTAAAVNQSDSGEETRNRKAVRSMTRSLRSGACGTENRLGKPYKTYCLCNGPEVLPMIKCSGEECPIEWFHFSCLKLKPSLREKLERNKTMPWFCKHCKK